MSLNASNGVPDQSVLPEQQGSSNQEPNFLLSKSFYLPLWRSLLLNIRDRVFPEKLPSLLITSRPVDVGMLVGDIVTVSWYRTIFSSIGDVISPETLPPLQLESRPVDVGELLSDNLSHLWWSSLLRNLADRVAPERLPPLELTSKPVNLSWPSPILELPRWGALITPPKVFLPERPKPAYAPPVAVAARVPDAPPVAVTPAVDPAHAHARKLKIHLSRSRWREALLISVAVVEAVYLVVATFVLN
jgi:hypothetical protein